METIHGPKFEANSQPVVLADGKFPFTKNKRSRTFLLVHLFTSFDGYIFFKYRRPSIANLIPPQKLPNTLQKTQFFLALLWLNFSYQFTYFTSSCVPIFKCRLLDTHIEGIFKLYVENDKVINALLLVGILNATLYLFFRFHGMRDYFVTFHSEHSLLQILSNRNQPTNYPGQFVICQ